MGRPKRHLLATAEQTSIPPDTLSAGQAIGRIEKGAGNNLYHVQLPSGQPLLVELPSRFRSTIWLKRGGYVLIDTQALAGRDNKLGGEIVNVVMNEKEWRKMSYWPKEFEKKSWNPEGEDDDDSTVGKLPPSESEEEEEEEKDG